MDQTAARFQDFRALVDLRTYNSELTLGRSIRIDEETKLLGEIEDIRDELGILRVVLSDQKTVTEELEALLGTLGPEDDTEDGSSDTTYDHTLKGNRVLSHHLARIDRLEILADRSIESASSTSLCPEVC